MINDYSEFIAPEELNNYVNGFSHMSNDDLSAFANKFALSFSIEQLTYIRDYFKNVKKMFPTYNQIFFFNEINKIRKAQKTDYSIYSATALDGAAPIMEASKDLLSKRSAIKRNVFGAMPISFASEIASEYLKKIGCSQGECVFKPAKSGLSTQYYIHTDEDIPLFTYANVNYSPQSNTQSVDIHNTIVMLCPADECTDDATYCSQVNDFTALTEISSIISGKRTVKAPYGIFEILMKEIDGVWVNLSNIPEIEKDPSGRVIDLREAIFSCYGRYVISTSNASIGALNRLAEEFSLKICVFAVAKVASSPVLPK